MNKSYPGKKISEWFIVTQEWPHAAYIKYHNFSQFLFLGIRVAKHELSERRSGFYNLHLQLDQLNKIMMPSSTLQEK